MVVKAEQERVKTLIADTVSLLCKNGLHYTKEFSIEGLLGITLDRDEVFLVNIKEFIKSGDYNQDSDSSGEESVSSKSPSKRKRRRSKSKQAGETTGGGDIDETSNDTSASFAHPEDNSTEPPAKKPSIKEEKEDESDDEDLVFIKDEPGADFSTCSFSDTSYSGAHSGNTNNILGDLSQQGSLYATPTSANSIPGASGWDQSQAAAFSQAISSQQNSPNAPPGQQPRVEWECHICGKGLQTASGYKRHMANHNGFYQYHCSYCGKGFNSKKTKLEHLFIHTSKNYFNCQECLLTFRYHRQLTAHKAKDHPSVKSGH